MIFTNLSKIWLGNQFPTQNSCVIKQGDYLSCLFGKKLMEAEKVDVLGSFQLDLMSTLSKNMTLFNKNVYCICLISD